MKKYNFLFIVCICLLSVFLLTSCGKKQVKEDVKSENTGSVAKKEEVKKKDLTAEEFISIGRKYGYKPIEETDLPKEQLENMKQKIANATKTGQIKSMTTIVSMSSNSSNPSDSSVSIAMLNICGDEATAKNFNQTIKFMHDIMNKNAEMQGKCTYAENTKPNGAVESVFKADISDEIKMYSMVSTVRTESLFIQYVGKNKDDLDPFLKEIGF